MLTCGSYPASDGVVIFDTICALTVDPTRRSLPLPFSAEETVNALRYD